MNSRQRIQAVLNGQTPDKLPIDFGGMRSTGIQAIAYAELLKYLGFKDEKVLVYDIFQQLAEPSEKIVDYMGGDVLQVHKRCPAFGISIEEYKESKLMSGAIGYFPKDFNPITNENGDIDILTPD